MSAATIQVLLIDDHHIFRQGVCLLLAGTPNIKVVLEASSGEQGLELFEQSTNVDLIITDLVLPDISGLDVIRRAKAHSPAVRTLLFTQYTEDDHINGMVAAGADGYLLKQIAVEELVTAIHTVMRGEAFLSPLVARRMMTQLRREHASQPETLSARERQTLALLAQGLTSKEIARKLAISPNTIDNHRARILVKLGVSNTAAAIRLAVRQGLIHSSEEK